MKQLSYSELRHRILIALSQKPESSITALASSLNSSRPSVSRAIKSLEEAHLVRRENRTLTLTEEGQEAVKELNASLASKVDIYTSILESARETASKQREQLNTLANSSIAQMASALQNGLAAQLVQTLQNSLAVQLTQSLQNSPALHLAQTLQNSLAAQLAQAFRNYPTLQPTINAIAYVQSINLSWLHSEITAGLSHLLLENNALLSSMMVDLEAMAKATVMPSFSLDNLLNDTLRAAMAYETYFKAVALSIDKFSQTETLKFALVTPTIATYSLVNSVRGTIELQAVSLEEERTTTEETTRVIIYSAQYAEITMQLVEGLKPLGERFINKWEGAWETLYSGSKDRHSQATHSARELLMQVLAYLAPDEIFTKEECFQNKVDKPNRKMRIKHILGSHSQHPVNLIDSFADTLDEMYHVFTGEAHRRDDSNKSDQTIAALLVALGSFLMLLLTWRNSDPS
jgi:DNA-binding MarR family transcriptional regulator